MPFNSIKKAYEREKKLERTWTLSISESEEKNDFIAIIAQFHAHFELIQLVYIQIMWIVVFVHEKNQKLIRVWFLLI